MSKAPIIAALLFAVFLGGGLLVKVLLVAPEEKGRMDVVERPGELGPARSEIIHRLGLTENGSSEPLAKKEIERVVDPREGVTPDAARAIQLAGPELDEVNDAVLTSLARLHERELHRGRVREVSDRRIEFFIEGSAEQAQRIEEELMVKLKDAIGERRTNALFSLGNKRLIRDLNYFGARDQEIVFEIIPPEDDRERDQACFRRQTADGTREVRAPITDSEKDRWLEHTPEEYRHLLFLVPPRR